MENVKNAETEISKSKQKREDRKKAAQKAKTNKIIGRIIENVVFVLLGALVCALIGMGIYTNVTKVSLPLDAEGNFTGDFSYGLTDEGMINGADLSSVKDIGLMNLSIPASEVVPSDETIDEKIDGLLSNNQEVATDSSLTVADGDKINLDYVGTIGGVEFDGGSTNGTGTDLTIGSGSYIEGFETQLIGTHPGDELNVEVTFPEDYGSEELAGKDAVFAVVVNGIYRTPEFNDEFVKKNYSEYASTAAEYRQYLIDQEYDSNLETYIKNYVSDNASVSKYPKNYLKNTKELLYYMDEQSYEYMMYIYSMYGLSYDADLFGYLGTTEKAYQNELRARGKKEVAALMTYGKAYKDAGLTVTEEDYNAVRDGYGDGAEETYGKPYLMQETVRNVVIAYIKEHANVQ